MSKYDQRKAELQKELVEAATTHDPSLTEEKRALAMAAAIDRVKAKLKKLDAITAAVAFVDKESSDVIEMLTDADDTLADDVRIAAMNKLRAALNTLHEAG